MTWEAVFLGVGFTGQLLFAARTILQWIASEREGRSVVPRTYWHLSVAAAACVLAYCVRVDNLVFGLSILPGAVIAVRNLALRGPARRGRLVPWAVAFVAVISWSVASRPHLGPPFWAALGLLGSLLWGGRFVVQWWVSERQGVSVLPHAFWVFSLVGSLLLLAYAVYRRDPVMILAYALGCIPYVRNLALVRRAAHLGSPR